LFMAQSSQRVEPPQNPGRFSPVQRRVKVQARAQVRARV
jgi:hypothetical protein